MRRAVFAIAVALAGTVILGAGGCAGVRSPAVQSGPTEASILLPSTLSVGDKKPSGAATLSLRLSAATASVNESITARVTYSNTSTSTAALVAPGGSWYNVRVTSSAGKRVFDSWPFPRDAALPPDIKFLAPGKSMSGTVRFALSTPGTYQVVAYLNGPHTPPITLIVSR